MKSKTLLIGFAGLSSLCINLFAFSDAPARHAPAESTTKASHSWSDGIYIKAGLGGMKYNNFKSLENLYTKKAPKGSLVYHAGIGYKINENFRTDFTLQYAEMKHKASSQILTLTTTTKQKIKSLAGFLNGYCEMEIQKQFYPYVTAGVGFARNNVGDVTVDRGPLSPKTYKGQNKTGFAWNAGAGIRVGLSKHFSIDAGYRFIDLYKISIKDRNINDKGGSQKIRGHQGLLSLIYNL